MLGNIGIALLIMLAVFAAGALILGVGYQLVTWIKRRLGFGRELPPYIRGPY